MASSPPCLLKMRPLFCFLVAFHTLCLSSSNHAAVQAVDSNQCPTFGTNDLIRLRDTMGFSIGRIVSTIRAEDADRVQTGDYVQQVSEAARLPVSVSSPVVNTLDYLLDAIFDITIVIQGSNGTDVRAANAVCNRLPLVPGDCYTRAVSSSPVVLEKVLQLLPLQVQTLDAILNTVGFFQEFDIPGVMASLPVPVTLSTFQAGQSKNGGGRRELKAWEASRDRLVESSRKLSAGTREAVSAYMKGRKEYAVAKKKPTTEKKDGKLSGLHRQLLGHLNADGHGTTNKEELDTTFLKTLLHKSLQDGSSKLRGTHDEGRKLQAAEEFDFSDEVWFGNTILSDLVDYFLDITDFLNRNAESEVEAQSCVAYNNETFAISSLPGFPPPVVYDFCNCASSAVGLYPLCSIQPSMNGFAATRINNKLEYDYKERIGTDVPFNIEVYDGYSTSEIFSVGDVWTAVDVDVSLPPFLSSIGPLPIPPTPQTGIDILNCAGVALTGATTTTSRQSGGLDFLPGFSGEMKMKSSMFFDLPENTETAANEGYQFVYGIEELNATVKFADEAYFNYSLFPSYGVGRLNSKNPTCLPSGFFSSLDTDVQDLTDDSLLPIIRDLVPTLESHADWGVILAEDSTTAQSMFIKTKSTFKWLGVELAGDFTFQYLDGENEFARRESFSSAGCCSTGDTCSVSTAPLRIPDVEQKDLPTVDFLLTIQEVVAWGLLTFDAVDLSFTYQPSLDPVILFNSLMLVPNFDWIPTEVRLVADKITGEWTATFFTSLMNALSSFPISLSGSHILIEGMDSSLQRDGDWDLFYNVEWGSSFVSESVEAVVLETSVLAAVDADAPTNTVDVGTPPGTVAGTGATITINSRSGNDRVDLPFWDGLVKQAKDGGGCLETVVEAIDEVVAGPNDVQPALQILSGALEKGQPVAASNSVFATQAVAAIPAGEVTNLQIAMATSKTFLVDGDLEATAKTFESWGYDYEYAFGLKSVVGKKAGKLKNKNEKDPYWGCEVQVYEWENCFEIEDKDQFNCVPATSGPFPEPKCFLERAQGLNDVFNIITDSSIFMENCGPTTRQAETFDLQLAPGMTLTAPTVFQFGSQNCQIPFQVDFTRVAADGKSQVSSVQAISNTCLDFGSPAEITASIATFIAEAGAAVVESLGNPSTNGGSTGNTGSNTGSNTGNTGSAGSTTGSTVTTGSTGVDNCTPLGQRICGTPNLSVIQKTNTVSMTCTDDFNSLNLGDLFGITVLDVDETCPTFFAPVFSYVTDNKKHRKKDDEATGCGPVEMTVQRIGQDCCAQATQPVEHSILVERFAPKFSTKAGSMDVTTTCDANIHPMYTGTPTFESGCPDALSTVSVVDKTTLDTDTCTHIVERSFLLRDDGCANTEQTFMQTITLEDNNPPEFDYFPSDRTIRIFDAYGTLENGFPTAFQKCGASPIRIVYKDAIVSTTGDAECSDGVMIIRRTFTATDACGREVSRAQQIRIVNEELPFGSKSLSFVYAGEELLIDNVNTTSCLVNSQACGILGAPDDNACWSASPNEFSGYRDFLGDREGTMGNGAFIRDCECSEGDKDCAKKSDKKDSEIYGNQLVVGASSDSCRTIAADTGNSNKGTAVTSAMACPYSSGTCSTVQLSGTSPFYNVFELEAANLGDHTIRIDAPPTSFVLINVVGEGVADVLIGTGVEGVALADGMSSSRILWNMPSGVNLKTGTSIRTAPYLWQGTMFNRLGSLTIQAFGQRAEVEGQIFAGTINFNGVRFLCDGHFVALTPQSCIAQQPVILSAQEGEDDEDDEKEDKENDKDEKDKKLVNRGGDFGF